MRFLFMIAYLDGSPNSPMLYADDLSLPGINNESDLLKVFQSSSFEDLWNECVFGVWEIQIPDNYSKEIGKELAERYAIYEAFNSGFTAEDTVSTCMLIDDNFSFPENSNVETIIVNHG